MKSEHRHELKTNSLDKFVSRLGAYFKQNGQTITYGLIGLFVVLAIVTVFVRSRSARLDSAWQSMIIAADPETYETIAEEKANQGTPVALWARLLAGERHYREGVRQYFTDRATGEEELELAIKAFEAVKQEKDASDVIRERALFGLARCQETTSDGNLQPAIDAYNALLSEYPKSIYKDDAEKRIEILESNDAESFYAWFSKQTTKKPEDLRLPRDGVSSGESESKLFDPLNEFKMQGASDNKEKSLPTSEKATEKLGENNESTSSDKQNAPKAPVRAPKPK